MVDVRVTRGEHGVVVGHNIIRDSADIPHMFAKVKTIVQELLHLLVQTQRVHEGSYPHVI